MSINLSYNISAKVTKLHYNLKQHNTIGDLRWDDVDVELAVDLDEVAALEVCFAVGDLHSCAIRANFLTRNEHVVLRVGAEVQARLKGVALGATRALQWVVVEDVVEVRQVDRVHELLEGVARGQVFVDEATDVVAIGMRDERQVLVDVGLEPLEDSLGSEVLGLLLFVLLLLRQQCRVLERLVDPRLDHSGIRGVHPRLRL